MTGIDIFEPALALARTNIASESGGERVEILHCDVTEFEAPGRFDAVWLPLPFLPEPIVPEAIQRCTQSLKPGGWLLPGTFAGPSDRLANLLTELRIVRSGGHPWTTDEMVAMLADAGLAKASELTSTWPAPVRMFAAQQA